MSLATTCPACSTTFRVTPEQLSAHRGDVRCGQCHHVFNALSRLVEVPPAPAPTASPQAELEFEAEPPNLDATATPPVPVETEPAETEHLTAQPEPEPEPEPPAEAALLDTAHLDLELDAAPEHHVIETAPPAPADPDPPQAETAPPPPIDVPIQATARPSVKNTRDFSIEKPARRRFLPGWLLAIFALLLLLTAAGQMAYFLRTTIASQFPPAKPWLEQGCMLLGCTVELPRHADMLVIEDSDLKDDADHDGVMVLTYVLYNRALYPQAFPLLELTLTDTFDKPVVRRTFTPREYLPKGIDAAAGIGAGSEASAQLYLTVNGDKPAGYRLWVTY